MKILRIAGCNLASLGEPFEVDFESGTLATAGVFAISGPTGAGKSTLLDALCLALYDATPRLARAGRSAGSLPDVGDEVVSPYDPRTLLRRGAAEGHAEVDFVGNDNVRYRARWSVRRARTRATGALQKSALSLQRLADGVALGGTKTEVAHEIAARVGLSFEQFTRAVLLAQNEFSAFLKTDESERGELLETLTGTEIYTALSRRAFERYKEEQAKLQQLSARLEDGMPMAAEQRAQMEAEAQAAAAALEAARIARDAAEAQWRWHEDDLRLQRGIAEATAGLESAQQQQASAAARRRALATIDAAQPARPLAADVARLGAETAAADATIASATQGLEQAQLAAREAHARVAAAQAGVQAAEQAQRDAAPVLDAAKALDARIAALEPGDAAARAALDAATAAAGQAQMALDAVVAERDTQRQVQAQAGQWLQDQRHAEALALQWPRWQKLFAAGERESAKVAELAAARQSAAEHARQAQAASERAGSALAGSAQRMQALEAARQAAIETLQRVDFDAMRQQRQQIDGRRDGLATAERRWSRLNASAAALNDASTRQRAAMSSQSAAEQERAACAGKAEALRAALAQAEASLGVARAACAESVEQLRATLAEGQPCPVCGSAAHPYHHQDAALQKMLANLEAQVTQCRAAAGDNDARMAALAATIAHCAAQAESLARDIDALAQTHQQAAEEWAADPHSTREGIDATWFAHEAAQLQAEGAALEQREREGRAALEARDRAQHACDAAAGEREQAQQAAAAAQSVHVQAAAQAEGANERHRLACAALDAILDELDGAFDSAGWRSEWQADAAAFRVACERTVTAWNQQSAALAEATRKLAANEAAHSAALERHAMALSNLDAARARFEASRQQLAQLRSERAALLDGAPVSEAERKLTARVSAQREQLAAQQLASQQTSLAEVRLREALDQARARRLAFQDGLERANDKLAAWIAGFEAAHPDLDRIADAASLAGLLGADPVRAEEERAALRQLDAAVAAAATVLAERSAQHARHRASSPPACSAPETLADVLARARAAWEEQNNTLVSLRLQLAQDDARRESAHTIMGQVEKQQQVERRWARMSDLIGSSDGKKFRNYAQQFTLDVLLGYANSHLSHLARRYRLERVPTAAGPSLGLLVRDQDMGGEIRSVNSLSGGESFLVSLALALGLASLSSNRVRVESLFIDEGFGSLDSETLRVAMDALDSLQAMGRKVGVISHVQEMADRISARIVVQPGGAGLSTVTVA